MKTKLLIIVWMLSGVAITRAQITPQQLIGEWRLDSLEDKNISQTEKQKRYIYTADSLMYKSRKLNTTGPYKIRTDGTSHEWYIQEAPKPLLIVMEFIAKDTLKITDGATGGSAGYLVRIADEAISHYQKGLLAEKQQQFAQAFQAFQEAANWQHPEAMYKLGMYYFTGTGIEINEKKGSKWIRAAAKLGNADGLSIVNSGSLRE